MLIKSMIFFSCSITTHIKIKDVHKSIKKEIIIKKLFTINNWFRKIYNKKPKMSILGLKRIMQSWRKTQKKKK